MLCCALNSICISQCGQNAFTILHFTKTSGFDHGTRDESATMFTEIGLIENFTIIDTEDESIFDDLDSLMTFAAIVFSNTSGENLFTALQQSNMETYINSGKGFLGIHAATDTYRDTTSLNSWPFYNELVGGAVQTNPNHTPASHIDTMDHQLVHPVLEQIPDPWRKQEEYYYWDLNGGMVDTNNVTVALKVRRTGPQSYDRRRPITWFREFSSGARSFYTALGHAPNNYTNPNNDFRQLVRNGICWVTENSAANLNPTIQLETQGSILINNSNESLILKSQNGKCWQLQVDDSGQLSTVEVSCP